MVGGGTGEHGQYQLQVDVAGAAFALDRVFVEVFEVKANYGNGSDYPLIVRANPNLITDPDLIFAGQLLKIPIGA